MIPQMCTLFTESSLGFSWSQAMLGRNTLLVLCRQAFRACRVPTDSRTEIRYMSRQGGAREWQHSRSGGADTAARSHLHRGTDAGCHVLNVDHPARVGCRGECFGGRSTCPVTQLPTMCTRLMHAAPASWKQRCRVVGWDKTGVALCVCVCRHYTK